MVVTNRTQVDPVCGAIRFWYRPGFDSGSGPGSTAVLLTLGSGSGSASVVWWTLAVSADGSTVSLACQSGEGVAVCLSAPVAMQINGSLTLFPQAARYTNGPVDLGYWYDALDYTVGNASLTGGTLTVEPGTALAVRNEYVPPNASDNYSDWITFLGFDVWEGASFISHGTPTRPNIFTAANLVQETPYQLACASWYGWWFDSIRFVPDFQPNNDGLPAPTLDFRFSQFYLPAQGYHLWSGLNESPQGDYTDLEFSPDSAIVLTLRDCSFCGGRINLGAPDYYSYDVTQVYGPGAVSWMNNLFDNVSINLDPTYYEDGWDTNGLNVDLASAAYNNLFRDGLLDLEPIPASAGNWVFRDNLFERVFFLQDTNMPLDFDHNAYWPLSAAELAGGGASQLQAAANGGGGNEQVLTAAPRYQTGPLGNYYLPPAPRLFGGGSRSPADAGLYHYTTRVDQTKEGEAAAGHNVNIGLHYIATAGPGSTQPRDTDGDGLPDYVENWHGDGDYNSHTNNETDWQNPMTDGVTPDPYNTIYDDVDLSGDGLVGRIKRALGMNPLDASNPLALRQVFTGQEREIATFEVPISWGVLTNIGGLNLNLDGIDVTLEDCNPATNGNCLLSWNTTYDPPGPHCLEAQLTVGSSDPDAVILSGVGAITLFNSRNVLRFFESDALYDTNGAYLDAQLAAQNANYIIELYDPSTTPATLLTTISNSTANGMIQEDWDLTYNNGSNSFAGSAFDAVFDVTLLDQTTGAPIAHGAPTKRHGMIVATEQGNGFDVAYMYTPSDGTLASAFSDPLGPVWGGMQGVVDPLPSQCGPGRGPGIMILPLTSLPGRVLYGGIPDTSGPWQPLPFPSAPVCRMA
jgi:hypothetical protein